MAILLPRKAAFTDVKPLSKNVQIDHSNALAKDALGILRLSPNSHGDLEGGIDRADGSVISAASLSEDGLFISSSGRVEFSSSDRISTLYEKNNEFTFVFRFKLDSTLSVDGALIGVFAGVNSRPVLIYIDVGGAAKSLSVYTSSSSAAVARAGEDSAAISTGVWHDASVTSGNGFLTIRLNGSQYAQVSSSITIGSSTSLGLSIGTDQAGSSVRQITGLHMDYVIPYDRALSNSEIDEIHSSPYQILKSKKSIFFMPDAGIAALIVQDLNQSQLLDNVALTQHNALSTDDLNQAEQLENVTLSISTALIVQSLDQSQLLGNVSLIQHNVLGVNDLSQSEQLDNVDLTQHNALIVDELLQAEQLENATLTSLQIIAQDLTQLQQLSGVSLIQHNILVVDALDQNQQLGNVSLSGSATLFVQDLTQSEQLSESLLSVAFNLIVDNLSQSQQLDESALTAHHVLVVNNMTQAQILSIVSFGATVIECLEGQITITTLFGGEVNIQTVLDGTITIQ